ncbi:cwf18 pre-mRNA splicing factor-domain-containing protein [Pseudoneurospora amorphoporcata]|uniref:Cwf18 pre-mRNA splicing factor-domain-containing protein n=1 Tax=Pseudoneurospora amorphoporcata TaxID=241081 RepID=A0AAN6SK87_9PEZI|nr:cwf18 pre-mRNA splicing factor-domain-containing protein [Pseudoneurospora amorphoporcata]
MSSHATLAAASDDRKARLAKLKSLKRKEPEPAHFDDEEPHDSPAAQNNNDNQKETTESNDGDAPPTTDVARLHLSGRNFDFETRGPKLGFEAPPTLSLEKPTLEEQAADIEEEAQRQAALDAQAAEENKGIDLFKLQPKKPNWDLKRELNQKMEVLNVRTDNAIARMVRERLAAKKQAAVQDKTVKGREEEDKAGMLEGTALVEGMKLREREEAEEERRERELEEAELAA